jgi:transposase
VGLDVHARSVAAAAIDGVTGGLIQTSPTPSHDHIRSWLADVPGPVAVVYEAGPTGFGLYRALTEVGVRCVVAAPSKLQRPSGDRVKTDAEDAVHLARLLRLDEITPVAVPTVSGWDRHSRVGRGCQRSVDLACGQPSWPMGGPRSVDLASMSPPS